MRCLRCACVLEPHVEPACALTPGCYFCRAIPAFEEAVTSMKQGGIRRIVVPVELGYPDNDFNKRGPKPSSFSVSLHLIHLHNASLWHVQYARSRLCT